MAPPGPPVFWSLLESQSHGEQVVQLVVVEFVSHDVFQHHLLLVEKTKVLRGRLLTIHVTPVDIEVVGIYLANVDSETVDLGLDEEEVNLLASGVHVVLLAQVLLEPEPVLSPDFPQGLGEVEVLDGVVVVLDDVVTRTQSRDVEPLDSERGTFHIGLDARQVLLVQFCGAQLSLERVIYGIEVESL